jgi:hypothetical protein
LAKIGPLTPQISEGKKQDVVDINTEL